MKLCIVVGARPNFIKAAPLITAINKYRKKHKKLSFFIIHTGQHFDDNMSEIFFREMKIPKPDYNLNVGSGHHGKQTGEMLIGLEEVLLKEKPDLLISIGDTNSTLAGALTAAKLHIPVAHVEGGLRMNDKSIAEDLNRLLIDHMSSLIFVPSKSSKENLLRESIPAEAIFNYGDIMYDAMLQFDKIAEKKSKLMQELKLKKKDFILATIHRAENTSGIELVTTILDAFVILAKEHKIVLPMHPRTRKILEQHKLLAHYAEHLTIIPPIGYLDMLVMEKNAKLVVTDSGGVQKEAFFQGTPCVIMFTTPWTELIDLKWNTVAHPRSVQYLVKNIKAAIGRKGKNSFPYGKGNTADLVVERIITYLKGKKK
jgi:UDP-GlcNAc3NAcA epimerase